MVIVHLRQTRRLVASRLSAHLARLTGSSPRKSKPRRRLRKRRPLVNMAPPVMRLRVDGTRFRDQQGREVTIHGINVAGDAKLPAHPDMPSHVTEGFFDGDDISFVGRPFTVDDAHIHFARLKKFGYNTIRYIFTWEAIEHAGPDKYDEEWIQHTIEVLRVAKDYGFYIFMDPHQDVWSRFSGGSGAPMWTLYACGLNPRAFDVTEAAIVHNLYPQPENFPKMIWTTNYTRLVCQTVWTLFFAGRDFAPRAIIDGKNIQDYLQEHFLSACGHLARRIHEAGDLEGRVVVGWENINEPNRGLVGYQDLTAIPKEQKLQKGTSPTAWQAMLLGSGRACEVETWDFGGMGPFKSGSVLVDPAGTMAWLPKDYDDSRYGWKRDPGWRLGECLWAQHGVWDPASDEILRKDYFAKRPGTDDTVTYEYFTNHWFMDYWRRHSRMVKSVFPDAIMFCEPPVLEIPPSIKGGPDDDPNMVFSPHYYDGVTLITKKWNRIWNVDVFGILRGKYLTPAFAVKIGETAIRNCLRDQLSAIRQEGLDYMGNHPCVFTEIGIPYDMDDKYAYKTGDYTSQALAMDANHFAIEGSLINGFTLWAYVAGNNHYWGDNWNGEDLSIFSRDDRPPPLSSAFLSANPSRTSLDPASPSYSQSHLSESASISPSTLKRTLTAENMTASASSSNSAVPRAINGASGTPAQAQTPLSQSLILKAGFRAAEAYIRPTPIATHGDVTAYGFDLRNCTFTLNLVAPSATPDGAPTEVFLPEWHFPPSSGGRVSVEVSGGKWVVESVEVNEGEGEREEGGEDGGSDAVVVQKLRWWHAEGDQWVKVKGVVRKLGGAGVDAEGEEVEEGYLEQCQQLPRGCGVM